MKQKKAIINLVQDLATPHNNELIQHFVGRQDVEIKLWYAKSSDRGMYQWTVDLSQEHMPAKFYGNKINLPFIRYCLAQKGERFVIVGWANINTKLLHMLFFLLRRPFNHWTDLPQVSSKPSSKKKSIFYWLAYKFLMYSNCKVFCVGRVTIDFFRTIGFPDHRLVNLPVFVSVSEDLSIYKLRRAELLERYIVPRDGFLLTAGSRLIHEKGYDLLISSITYLLEYIRKKVRLVIVGSGVESKTLLRQIKTLGLEEIVTIEEWLDIADFKTLIANSDIFLHPARFDSFGGTALGMALGVPVIGTYGAGAAIDRIDHGVNGFLYEATDINKLANYISFLLNDGELRRRMGEAARETASQWHPRRGVSILVKHSI